MMKKILVSGLLAAFSTLSFAKTYDLSEGLKMALDSHPSIEVSKSIFIAESRSVTPLYFPDNPMIGIMKQNDAKSWTLSQELLFPSKYYHRAEAQAQRAQVGQEELKNKRLEIRQKVISAYYSRLMQIKNLENLGAQRDLLREIARIAESRRSIGQVTAQDEMKAHLEQSKIENDILLATQDFEMGNARLKELLGVEEPIEIGNLEVPVLKFRHQELNQLSMQNTPTLKIAHFQLAEAKALKSYARDSFLPDFKISLQGSLEKESNEKSIALEMKFPLWFWAKESAEFSSAAAKSMAASKNTEVSKRQIQLEQRSLLAKIAAKENILKLYTTTLLPQAKSTISSSRAAYQAGRVNLMELLDSERTLYALQTSYYQELKDFSETIALLETTLGQSLSSLPFGDVI